MKLYLDSASPNAHKVLSCVTELGVEVEVVGVDLGTGVQRQPEFLALNPMGKIPLLVDGDFKLWESNAIMQYLCRQVPGQTLWPHEARAQADVERWLCWQLAHWGHALNVLLHQRVLNPLRKRPIDEALCAAIDDEVRGYGQMLEEYLSDGRPWICGEHLTLADIAIGAPMSYRKAGKFPIEDQAKLAAWFDRLCGVPSFAAHLPKLAG